MVDLAAKADLATFLGVDAWAAGTAEDSQAALALRIASSTVRSRTGQTFTAGTSTVALPTPDGQWLYLPKTPVVSIDALSIDGVAVTDYTVIGNRVFRYVGWDASDVTAPVVMVTYTYGGTVPDEVLGATLAVAADIFENPTGLSSETIDDYTWRRSDSPTGMLAEQMLSTVERAYRRRPLTVQLG
jgi:hypothetical protein